MPRAVSRPEDYSQPGASSSSSSSSSAVARPGSEARALVQAHTCSGALFGFYDRAAAIDVDKLAAEADRMRERGAGQLLGFWVGRRNARLRPSVRDAAVYAALCGLLADGATAARLGVERQPRRRQDRE